MWVFGGHVSAQVLRLASNLILTRLLVPEMFGIMTLANVLVMALYLFSDFGLRQSVIQNHRSDPPFLNTVWTIQVIRGGVIWLLLISSAFLLKILDYFHWLPTSSVYAEPILPSIIFALSFSSIISGFESTKLATANRNLILRKLTQIDLAGQIVSLVVIIGWAWIDRSIWALVVGTLVGSIVRTILSHFYLEGELNKFHWDKTAVNEIFNFGKWIFLTSILGFLASNGDRLILGGLIDAKTMGLYSVAFFLVNAIQDVTNRIIGIVALPTLSEIARTRPNDLRSSYYKFRLPIDIATLLLTGLIMSSGHLIIQVLYDSRYTSAGAMLDILGIALFEVRFGLANQCFIALGKPKLLAPTIILRIIALYGVMPLAYLWFGLNGSLWVVGGSALFSLPVTIYFKIKHGLFSLSKEIRVLPFGAVGYLLGMFIVQIFNFLVVTH